MATMTTLGVADLFIIIVYRIHGMPWKIICDLDPKFFNEFWAKLFKMYGTKIKFSATYYPKTYSQIERMNKVIGDMLWMYVVMRQ